MMKLYVYVTAHTRCNITMYPETVEAVFVVEEYKKNKLIKQWETHTRSAKLWHAL